MLNISCRVRHCLAGQSALASLTPLGKHVPINYFLEGIAFSALTLMVGCHEEHPACKNID